jgi:hypothetical protein
MTAEQARSFEDMSTFSNRCFLPLFLAVVAVVSGPVSFLVAGPQRSADPSPLTDRERALLERVEKLEARIAALEAKSAPPATSRTVAASGEERGGTEAPPDEKRSLLSFVPGATFNLYLDGYYGYNFNRPAGRVNLLRANDVLSNNFTLNQAGIILERAPDVASGRRFGGRVDLMFGQNTETLQGGAQNEPRPQVYRNLFQAYGTYVFPLGSGVTVDFGKFYSALGYENNYAYDEINYSRSYYFNYLPFYHTGLRTTYNLSGKLVFQHWLVNGANQTEDFNGFKSNAFLVTVKPASSVSWNLNYYLGRESRELVPAYNPGIPAFPSQPGLSTTLAPGVRLNGRSHILDTYASWSPTGRTAFAGEFDYVVSRSTGVSAPAHVIGGAAYVRYGLTGKLYLSGRFEYLGDHGGLFSGLTQHLKEHTVTATYQPADSVQLRLEYRRDYSNRPFFLTSVPGVLKKEQNTAAVGMIWWFGGKRESW